MKILTRWRLMAGVALVTSMVGAALAQASDGHGEHAASLELNWWQWSTQAPPIGWFLLDFALFFGALVYFAAKPLAQAFAQRHLTIKRAISEAAAAHAKASARQREYKDKLARIEDEARSLLDGSREGGAQERDQIVKQAKEYASRLSKDSETLAEQELQRARGRLRAATVQAALGRAESLLRKELTPADQQRLLELSIQDLETGKSHEASRARSKAGLSLVTGGAA
jgi:F-type H+-transporting ATPase subunit b